MGSDTSLCCATPEWEEQGSSCTEMQRPNQNTSKMVCFYGTKGTGAMCRVWLRLCNPQRLPSLPCRK